MKLLWFGKLLRHDDCVDHGKGQLQTVILTMFDNRGSGARDQRQTALPY
jgi:hypothetical protein